MATVQYRLKFTVITITPSQAMPLIMVPVFRLQYVDPLLLIMHLITRFIKSY